MSPDRGEATVEAWVEAWCREDRRRALSPSDRELVEGTRALRSLVVEGLLGIVGERDRLNACWRLGHWLAERDGSPTLVSATMRGVEATCPPATDGAAIDWATMTAAAYEGFSAARAERARTDARRAWDPPHCVVRLDDETIAVACGIPEDDGDALGAWADRVAHAAARAGVRRAYATGRDEAVRALREAFQIAGIVPAADAPARTGLTSLLPWKRARR